MGFRLPRLQASTPLTDGDTRPSSAFQRYWQTVVEQIERAILTIVDLTGIQEQFEAALRQLDEKADQLDQATQAAQNAADAAQAATDATKREQALVTSYIEPASVLTANPITITIAPHIRYYSDGTSVSVNGGTVAATAPGDTDFVSYSDPDREGGAVQYEVSTSPPVQTGDTHVVGAVAIPATGTAPGGEGPQRPGYVKPYDIAE